MVLPRNCVIRQPNPGHIGVIERVDGLSRIISHMRAVVGGPLYANNFEYRYRNQLNVGVPLVGIVPVC